MAKEYAASISYPVTPANLVNFGEAVNFPLIFGLVLIVFGITTLVHVLVVSVARRRREAGLEGDVASDHAAAIEGLGEDSRLIQEEIFGPVLSVIPAVSEQEAVRLANDGAYGLAAYIWTSDLSRAHRVARQPNPLRR